MRCSPPASCMNGQVPLGEAIAFWILGPLSLAGAIGMVLLRNAIHSALSLVATMMSPRRVLPDRAGPVPRPGADHRLHRRDHDLVPVRADARRPRLVRLARRDAARPALGRGLFGGIGFALLVALSLGRAFTGATPTNLDAPNSQRHQRPLASPQLLFTKYLFAFELTSALLIVAAVGAMVLAHIERDGPKPTQKSLARERIRSGRPQPLPGPGVLSTGNAIGTPALLPDGSIVARNRCMSSHDPGGRRAPQSPVAPELGGRRR